MDFKWTASQEQLRAQVRGFLDRTFRPALASIPPLFDPDWSTARDFVKLLAAEGLMAPAWPVAHGGMGLGHVDRAIVAEELALSGAPDGGRGPGINFLGPVLLRHGTEEQRQRILPDIVTGAKVWCQGFSEPEAGSDLASLTTRAVKTKEGFVVNGQKIWTSYAVHADWCFLLARTDPSSPSHRGISFLLTPMDSPGIRVQPIQTMIGQEGFAHVFFDDVFIPSENLVGNLNEGWQVTTDLLNYERAATGSSGAASRILQGFIRVSKARGGLTDNLRIALAELYTRTMVSRLLAYRLGWLLDEGVMPGPLASMVKLFVTELQQEIASFGSRYLGLQSQIVEGELRYVGLNQLRSTALTIAGGTSEIQRTVIAKRGLGLS